MIDITNDIQFFYLIMKSKKNTNSKINTNSDSDSSRFGSYCS